MKWVAAQTFSTTAGILTYPLDTVSRRLMMQSGRSAEDVIYKGTIDCFRVILREESFFGLYKGIFVKLFTNIGTPIALVLY